MQRLVLIYGGQSSEHDISIRGATQLLGAVDRARYDLIVVGIRRDGEIRTGPSDSPLTEILSSGRPVTDLRELGADVFFPLLHGPFGEDGRIQGLLETWGLPYVGCGVLSSAVCMDKAMLKQLAGAQGIPVVPGVNLRRHQLRTDEDIDAAVARIELELGFPCFVKPANQGSSIGVSKAQDATQLSAAVRVALRYDTKIVVERGLDVREVEIAILGNGGPKTLVSAPGEIVLPAGTWYDYDNKYQNEVAGLAIPAELQPSTSERLRTLARQAFEIGECQGLARVDFLIERSSGDIYLNEINTMPGFTQISMYPKLMRHAGVEYDELIVRLCDLGIDAARQRAELSIDC